MIGTLVLIKNGTQEQIKNIPSEPYLQEIKESTSNKHDPGKRFIYLIVLYVNS